MAARCESKKWGGDQGGLAYNHIIVFRNPVRRSSLQGNLFSALGNKIHKISLQLPKYELYEEGSQIRRSSKAITSCIVEGYGRKKYKADFIKFLIYAHASCDETILHLNFIKDTHELNEKEIEIFFDTYNKLGGKINKFIQYVETEWK